MGAIEFEAFPKPCTGADSEENFGRNVLSQPEPKHK